MMYKTLQWFILAHFTQSDCSHALKLNKASKQWGENREPNYYMYISLMYVGLALEFFDDKCVEFSFFSVFNPQWFEARKLEEKTRECYISKYISFLCLTSPEKLVDDLSHPPCSHQLANNLLLPQKNLQRQYCNYNCWMPTINHQCGPMC